MMRRPPGWLVGIAVAVAALMILGFDVGLFASLAGMALAAGELALARCVSDS